jgi:putative NADH-flavin reductase
MKSRNMKKIALLGASGQTGQQFLIQALAKGYSVKALVRNPEKITQKSPNLTLIKGDILNQNDVNQCLEDTDIVVSLFGRVKDSPDWLQANGTQNLLNAIQKHKIERIISLSGGGLPYPEKDEPKLADRIIRTIMGIVAPKLIKDAIRHHEVLKASQTKWMIVRGPRLTNDPEVGKYRVGWVGVNASTKISRADLAAFIITQVEDETFNYQLPFVSN